ncbi:MAG: hypothetical protein HY040_15605 [Planctomycetes bacterium]|nr:hypothetical protein [Planctomycetota bacterium]
MEPNAKPSGPAAGPIHYRVMCSFCLGVIFLAQMQQGLFLGNILVLLVGILGLMSRMRIGPILLLVFFAGVQMNHKALLTRGLAASQTENLQLQIHELALCAAVFGYVVGHYRLQSIWHNLWPVDPRHPEGPRRRFDPRQQQSPVREPRPSQQITPLELARFVVSLPVWILLGTLIWGVLNQRWELFGLPQPLVRIVILVICLGVVSFGVRMGLGFWRHRRRDHAAARLFLQDVLWNETRGEQRRLNRWLAWLKIEKRAMSAEE